MSEVVGTVGTLATAGTAASTASAVVGGSAATIMSATAGTTGAAIASVAGASGIAGAAAISSGMAAIGSTWGDESVVDALKKLIPFLFRSFCNWLIFKLKKNRRNKNGITVGNWADENQPYSDRFLL